MVDLEMLDAIRKIVREETKPLKEGQLKIERRLNQLEEGQERLTDIVEESLTLHDELEGRVKALEAKVI